jgi:hypothetical protein
VSVKGYAPNFESLLRAAKENVLCIMEVDDTRLGRAQAALCAVHIDEDGLYVMTPFAVMCEGNPYEYLVPPEGTKDG